MGEPGRRVVCAVTPIRCSLLSRCCAIIAFMQLDLIPYEFLSAAERSDIYSKIRNAYYHLRNVRGGRFGQARRRRYYRLVAAQKKRLLLAGVSKRELLDFLACCRLQCAARKQPSKYCSYCIQTAAA